MAFNASLTLASREVGKQRGRAALQAKRPFSRSLLAKARLRRADEHANRKPQAFQSRHARAREARVPVAVGPSAEHLARSERSELLGPLTVSLQTRHGPAIPRA